MSCRILFLDTNAAFRAHASVFVIIKLMPATGADLIETVLTDFINFIVGFIGLHAFLFYFTFHLS